MGMSKCYSLMKCLLIFINIILLVVGASVVAFCAWVVGSGAGGAAPEARVALAACGAWGGALAVGAAAGLWGAARAAPAPLAASFALLALCAVAEGAAAWWGAAHAPSLRRALLDRLHSTLRHEYGVAAASTQLLDLVQQKLDCCGVDGPLDWQSSAWARASRAEGEEALDLRVGSPAPPLLVPASCCGPRAGCSAEGGGAARLERGAALAGCGGGVLAALEQWARGLVLCAGGVLAAQALGLLLTLPLCLRAPHRRLKA